jgi:RNA polymerase sigma factor (sigma-70 family)
MSPISCIVGGVMAEPSHRPPQLSASGGRRDLASLVADEQAPMTRLAVLLVGSRAIADEVVQDAFAAVGERWDQLDRPGAYLRTAVVNGCRGALRRRKVEERHVALLESEPTMVELPVHLIELREALRALTERQRVVVVLRYFVDLPDEDIAAILDCRLSTVRSLTRRALAVLRKELQ